MPGSGGRTETVKEMSTSQIIATMMAFLLIPGVIFASAFAFAVGNPSFLGIGITVFVGLFMGWIVVSVWHDSLKELLKRRRVRQTTTHN
jgi:hypothetical protein